MKYTIHGFSQEQACKFRKIVTGVKGKEKEIKIDCTDLLILRWLVDFYPKMVKVEIEGAQYAWVNYKELLNDLPLLDIKKQALADRFQKMCDFGILKHKTIKNNGTYSYYGFGTGYYSLIDTEYSNTEGVYSDTQGVCSQLQKGVYSTTEQNNPSTIYNPSTKDNKKERKTKQAGYDSIVNGYTENDELRNALFEFIKMRSRIKKPLTDRALELICKKLDSFGNDERTRQLILEQSVMNCWQGVYPLKQELAQQKSQTPNSALYAGVERMPTDELI